jgi:hydroxylamine reductase
MTMFCYQCEQTAGGTACTTQGVCGKDPQTAALQDLLLYAAKDIARFAHCARGVGGKDRDIDVFVVEALFSAVTNVNFDPLRLETLLKKASAIRDQAAKLCRDTCAKAGRACQDFQTPVVWWTKTDDLGELVRLGEEITIRRRIEKLGPDVAGLQELLAYGLKGAAAYVDHAQILGKEDDEVYAFFHEALAFLAGGPKDTEALLKMALRCGEVNLKVMGLLDAANTGAYGHPEPTRVRITPKAGKAIAVSGHDLKDLEELLKQSVGEGVNVYTHGEMLPAHAYPGLKKFPHLVGNYGGAWQDQRKEFDAFPGSILMTTNCIQRPAEGYKARLFTSGLVAWPGVRHIGDHSFHPVIEAAKSATGFAQDGPEKFITIGFAHEAVMKVAGKVVEAVKSGAIRRFFLIGGCDGAKSGRNYYTEFAQAVPKDCVILTLACGKYRFNKLDFGDIGGIPRLLDCGQCNDAYSAIQIALALAGAFHCGVNDLPLTLVLSWYEQKAVAILLTLLHLGIKGMRIGPSLPAFVSPSVLAILADKFNLRPITTPQADLAEIMQ